MTNLKAIFIGPRLVSFFGKETIGGGTVLFENAIYITPGKQDISDD